MEVKLINELYRKYFNGDILYHHVFERNYEVYEDYRIRILVDDSLGQKLIFKGYCNDYNNIADCNKYCAFMDDLKKGNVRVPNVYLNSENEFCTGFPFNNKTYVFWVEENVDMSTLEDKIEFTANKEFFKDLGELLGEQHTVSKKMNLRLSTNTEFRFSSDETVDENFENYEEVLKILSNYHPNEEFDKDLSFIRVHYKELRTKLNVNMDQLDYGAVQGDLSPNNIIMKNGKPYCLIDYNQAGNDVYICDMMQWATYIVYGLFQNGDEEEMKENYESFYRGYTKSYKVNCSEEKILPVLYKLIRYLRCNQVWDLQDMDKNKDIDQIRKYVKKLVEGWT